ncbi:MAG: hypothetical protein ABIE74_08995, partial [Pseudomonadota bacterium]
AIFAFIAEPILFRISCSFPMGLPCFLSPILHLIQAPFLVQFLPTIIHLHAEDPKEGQKERET